MDSIETQSTTLASTTLQDNERSTNYLTNLNKTNNSFVTPFENGIQVRVHLLNSYKKYHTLNLKTIILFLFFITKYRKQATFYSNNLFVKVRLTVNKI